MISPFLIASQSCFFRIQPQISMPLSSAERFPVFKAKLKLEKNGSLLRKFREKDAAAHREIRQIIKQDPEKMTRIRGQNRLRQAKRRLKLTSEKLGSHFKQSCSLSTSSSSQSSYKCVRTLAKAVHRSERGLPNSPTKKKGSCSTFSCKTWNHSQTFTSTTDKHSL